MMNHVFKLMACIAGAILMTGVGVGTVMADANHGKAPGTLMTASDSRAHEANEKGITHYKAGHWDAALKYFKKAVEADPESAEAHYNLALALDKSDQHREAAMEFKKALDLGQNNPDIQNSKILHGHVKKLQGSM